MRKMARAETNGKDEPEVIIILSINCADDEKPIVILKTEVFNNPFSKENMKLEEEEKKAEEVKEQEKVSCHISSLPLIDRLNLDLG